MVQRGNSLIVRRGDFSMYTNTPFEGMSRAEGWHPFIGLGLGSRGAYTQGGSICIPGVGLPDIYLLPRREKYTRVYTFVYPRVHNSVQACTQHRSRYVPCRALVRTPDRRLTLLCPREMVKAPEYKK